MKSLIFEKRYGEKIPESATIQDIIQIVESKENVKIEFTKSNSLLMAKGGNVFDITHINPNSKIDEIIS